MKHTEISAVGHMQLAPHGKHLVAASMYAKGKAFLRAAVLLRQKGGHEFVVLHLLCQGIEVTLKGILLFIDYELYKPRLRLLGHKLVCISEVTIEAADLLPLKNNVRSELEVLNNLYVRHLLRYGSGYDLLINPTTISANRIFRRMCAVLRLFDRKYQ